jgi:hypothetical protein
MLDPVMSPHGKAHYVFAFEKIYLPTSVEIHEYALEADGVNYFCVIRRPCESSPWEVAESVEISRYRFMIVTVKQKLWVNLK